jgi:hypothetical protein
MKGQQVWHGTGFQRIARLLNLFLVTFGIIVFIASALNQYLGMYASMVVAVIAAVGSVMLYNYSSPTPRPWNNDIWLSLILVVVIYFIAKSYPTMFPLTFSVIRP